MKKINFNKIGRTFTILLIFGFIINDFLSKSVDTLTIQLNTTGALIGLGHSIHYLSSAIIFASCIIALSILFSDNKI